jgi:hypothetical protein
MHQSFLFAYSVDPWNRCRAKIKEKYILMSEPDHIWLRPMPNLMKGRRPAAFPFFYIGDRDITGHRHSCCTVFGACSMLTSTSGALT